LERVGGALIALVDGIEQHQAARHLADLPAVAERVRERRARTLVCRDRAVDGKLAEARDLAVELFELRLQRRDVAGKLVVALQRVEVRVSRAVGAGLSFGNLAIGVAGRVF
jgi:hypothetical protein